MPNNSECKTINEENADSQKRNEPKKRQNGFNKANSINDKSEKSVNQNY